METKSPSILRQEWIETAAQTFKAHFAANWWTVQDNIRLSIGFPVGSKDGKKKLGICHNEAWSADSHWEIFISPDYSNTNEILETIAHEMIHATVKVPGHRGKFKECAIAVGFEAPFSYTPAGPKMQACIDAIKAQIGEFPAGILSLAQRKKQPTRLLKCECMDCGYIARVTAKWVASVGAPICPVDEVQMVCD